MSPRDLDREEWVRLADYASDEERGIYRAALRAATPDPAEPQAVPVLRPPADVSQGRGRRVRQGGQVMALRDVLEREHYSRVGTHDPNFPHSHPWPLPADKGCGICTSKSECHVCAALGAATPDPAEPGLPCDGCGAPLDRCQPLWAEQRKCCPDCEGHVPDRAASTVEPGLREAIATVRDYGVSIGWAGGAGDAVSEVLHRLEARTPDRAASTVEPGLREDARYLTDALAHMLDHLRETHPDFACEDLDNVRHFTAKVRAALTPDETA